MASASRRSRRSNIEIWPGFVDALSQLVIVIIFVLLIFTAGQFFLSDALYGSNEALARLNSQISDLVDQLAFEKKTSDDLRRDLSQLTSQLQAANVERDALTARLGEMSARADDAAARANRSAADFAGAQSTVDQLNQQLAALRQQLAQLAAALDASEVKSKEQQVQIADLGKRLNAALASKVEELARYRSEFFGRLREVLGDRQDIHVVGDRFVFQSEVLFGMASADPEFDEAGTWAASSFLRATAHDYARFGLFYLRDGMWDGVRILPAGWVDYARTMVSTDEDGQPYGAHWWGVAGDNGLGTFRAAGYEGQSISICPPLDLVVVRLGKTPVDRSDNLVPWRVAMIQAFADAA